MKHVWFLLFWGVVYYSGLNAIYILLSKKRLTLLGYHSISNVSNKAVLQNDVYKHLSVPVAVFEQQLVFLRKRNYTFLRFSDLRDIREGKCSLPRRAVLVYFDDGYKDNYINAYPILKRLGIPATIFVVTDCLDKKKILWDADFSPADARIFLSWEELRIMRDVFDIGSHTVTHRKLTELRADEVREECMQSHRRITEMTGTEPVAFSYPKSRWTPDIRRVVGETGFEFILAHGRGFHHSANFRYLEKIPVGPEDTMLVFGLKLDVYYPLMNMLQYGATIRRA